MKRFVLSVVAFAAVACAATTVDVTAHGLRSATVVVPADAGPPDGVYDTTEGATDTHLHVESGDALSFMASGRATYGAEGPPCLGEPETEPTGQTRYLPGGMTCPGKFDPNSIGHGYIGALLFGVACEGTSHVAVWQAFYPSYDGRLAPYVGCAGELLLLYNDVPGSYGDNGGDYAVSVLQEPGGGGDGG